MTNNWVFWLNESLHKSLHFYFIYNIIDLILKNFSNFGKKFDKKSMFKRLNKFIVIIN
jgi:hypothetical protein